MPSEPSISAERRAILMVFVLTGLAVGIAVMAFWMPMRRRQAAVHAQLLDLRRDLSAYREQDLRGSAADKLDHARRTHEWLRVRRDRFIDLHDTFRQGNPLQSLSPTHEEGRIDFKVALFNARTSLLSRAGEQQISIPPSLGMEETIGAGVLAETRLWQLASTVRLLEHLLQAGIPVVEQIHPLDPRTLPLEDHLAIRFYPLRVRMWADYPDILNLLETLVHSDAFFSMRRFRIERPSPDDPRLRLQLRCDAARKIALPAPPAVGDPRPESVLGPVPSGRNRGRSPPPERPAEFPLEGLPSS